MQAITKVFSDIVKPYIDSENQTLANKVKENWSDSKNLLPPILHNNAASITYIGVTLTIDDLKFKIIGTATGDGGRLNLRTDPFILKAGTYTISGVIGAATAVHKTSDNAVIISRVTPNEYATFTLETDTSVFVGINVANGVTYNQTVGLQIEKGLSATPYHPYAKSNTELTKDDIGLTENAFAHGAVNLLPSVFTDVVKNGVTFTVNDGIVTANGTASATINYNVNNAFPLKAGAYRLSGCPSGGAVGLYKILLAIYYSDSTQDIYNEFGDGVTFSVKDKTINRWEIRIDIYNGFTASNLVFKPMITVADMPNSDYDHYVSYAMTNRELSETYDDLIASSKLNLHRVGKVVNVTTFGNAVVSDLLSATVPEQFRPRVDSSIFCYVIFGQNRYVGRVSFLPSGAISAIIQINGDGTTTSLTGSEQIQMSGTWLL